MDGVFYEENYETDRFVCLHRRQPLVLGADF
jgi:hypothetical protein